MDFSPWDRAKSFQLHEAACLIAGVMPSSKRIPDREELPSNALKYYKSLATAYVMWVMRHDQPDDPNYPKAEMLRGEPQIGRDEPTLSVSIDKLTGEFVSREELHRWVKATGITSAYAFAPWSRLTTPSPAPVVAESASGATAWTVNKPERYRGYSVPLHRFLAAAHREGKPRPSARDVIEEWRVNLPAEIAQVLSDGVNYYNAEGNTKSVGLEAIRKAIRRMTSGR